MNEDQAMAEELVEVPNASSYEDNHQLKSGIDHVQERKTMEDDEDEGEGSGEIVYEEYDENGQIKKKKDKKLVFLSRSVLEKIKERPMTTGT